MDGSDWRRLGFLGAASGLEPLGSGRSATDSEALGSVGAAILDDEGAANLEDEAGLLLETLGLDVSMSVTVFVM
jgi:hypothetical protein